MSTALAPLPKLPPSPPPPGLPEGDAAPPGGRHAPLPTLSAGHGGTLGAGRRSLPPGGRRAPLSPPRTPGGQRLPVNPGSPVTGAAPQAKPQQRPRLSPEQIEQVRKLLPSSANQGEGRRPRISPHARLDTELRDRIVASYRPGKASDAAARVRETMEAEKDTKDPAAEELAAQLDAEQPLPVEELKKAKAERAKKPIPGTGGDIK